MTSASTWTTGCHAPTSWSGEVEEIRSEPAEVAEVIADMDADEEALAGGGAPAPRMPKRTSLGETSEISPPKTLRLGKKEGDAAVEPTNADLLSCMQQRMKRQEHMSTHIGDVYRTVTSRLDTHGEDISRLHKHIQNIGEKMDNIELGGVADAQFRDPRLPTSRSSTSWRRSCSASTSRRRLRERHGRRGHPRRRMWASWSAASGRTHPRRKSWGSLSGSYAQSWRSASTCRLALSLLAQLGVLVAGALRNSGGFKVKLNGEELNLWSTMQKTRDQKDRAQTLMRLASYAQSQFHDVFTNPETYKLICWRSGTLVVFDRRVVRLENKLVWYDGWHADEWYKTTAQNMKDAMEDILATDLPSSRT